MSTAPMAKNRTYRKVAGEAVRFLSRRTRRAKTACHACGKGELVQEIRDMPYTYKGRTTVLKGISGEWCTSCGEVFLYKGEIDNFMAAARAFKKEVNAALDGAR